MRPYIDIIAKIDDTLGASIDYLVEKTYIELDKNSLNWIENIAAL